MRSRALRLPSIYGVVLVSAVCVQSFVSFLDGNRDQLAEPGQVAIYALLTTAASLALLSLAVGAWRGAARDRVAVVVAIVVACFLNFSAIFSDDTGLFESEPRTARELLVTVALWLLLTGLLARVGYLVGGSPDVRLALVIFVSVLVAMPSASYVGYQLDDRDLSAIEDPGTLPVPEHRPNVYWVILDGYARQDILEQVSDYDNGPFVSALEARGFQVSSSSLTSYPRTHLSLSSTLEMDYVAEPGGDATDEYARLAPIVAGHNRTTTRFRALGYETAYGPAGALDWAGCRPDLVDACLPVPGSWGVGELEKALLDRTPLGMIPLPVPYADPLTFADGLADPALGIDAPFFAYQHVLSPHNPFRYRADCSPRSRPVNSRSPEHRTELYRTEIGCLNQLVLRAIDQILERDPTAVMILQSDHGSDQLFRWLEADQLSQTQLRERFGALNAMRLPAGCDEDIEGEALVNTFRVVFACIEGREPELLPYRGFETPLGHLDALAELPPELVAEISEPPGA